MQTHIYLEGCDWPSRYRVTVIEPDHYHWVVDVDAQDAETAIKLARDKLNLTETREHLTFISVIPY